MSAIPVSLLPLWNHEAGPEPVSVRPYLPPMPLSAPSPWYCREFLEVLVDGRPVNIGPGKDGMMITTGEVEGWDCVDREDVCVDLKTVPQVLKDLGIITDDMGASTELFAADAELDEAVCFVGGCYCPLCRFLCCRRDIFRKMYFRAYLGLSCPLCTAIRN